MIVATGQLGGLWDTIFGPRYVAERDRDQAAHLIVQLQQIRREHTGLTAAIEETARRVGSTEEIRRARADLVNYHAQVLVPLEDEIAAAVDRAIEAGEIRRASDGTLSGLPLIPLALAAIVAGFLLVWFLPSAVQAVAQWQNTRNFGLAVVEKYKAGELTAEDAARILNPSQDLMTGLSKGVSGVMIVAAIVAGWWLLRRSRPRREDYYREYH